MPGKAPVVVLSNAFWKRAFNADPNIVGKRIMLNGFSNREGLDAPVRGRRRPRRRLPAERRDHADGREHRSRWIVFLPLPLGADAVKRRGDENYNLMARLKPGVTMAQAQADVAAIAARIREKDKRDRTFTIDVVPLVESVVGNVRRAVLVVMGSVTLVLLIACANVANLLLTRATGAPEGNRRPRRARRELAAARPPAADREPRCSVSWAASPDCSSPRSPSASIRAINPGNIPRLDAIGLDGTRPRLHVRRVDPHRHPLRPGAGAARGARRSQHDAQGRRQKHAGRRRASAARGAGCAACWSWRKWRSRWCCSSAPACSFAASSSCSSVSPGFDPEGVVSMRLGAIGAPVRESRRRRRVLRDRSATQLASVPGVKERGRGVGAAVHVVGRLGRRSTSKDGRREPGQELQVDQRGATTNYFSTMKIPLIAGRFFTDADMPQNAEPVVDHRQQVRAALLAEGRRDRQARVVRSGDESSRIVGVVGTVKQYGLDVDGRIVVYRPSPSAGYQVARTIGRSGHRRARRW